MKTTWTIAACSLLFVSLGCGASTPEPASQADSKVEAAPPTSAVAATPPAVPDTWSADLTAEQKAEFMKQKVMPAMEPIFKAEEPGEAFSCETCHGPDFKLPKDFLPRLTFKDNQLTAFAEDPEVAKFMAEKVTPAMASVLGLPPFDPATQKGFGCGGCHAIDMK
jgi:hypothetical protein